MSLSLLAVNNNRSKAYLQNMIKHGFTPEKVIYLYDDSAQLVENSSNFTGKSSQKLIHKFDDKIFFDEKEHILTTLEKHNIKYNKINNIDINSQEVLNAVKALEQDYVVYSGPGGAILSTELVNSKKFIHVHPGAVPSYKGSTTYYYSILLEGKVGASVIIMSDGIDEGDVLYTEEIDSIPKDLNIDNALDPLFRAKVLVNCLNGGLSESVVQKEKGHTFYIVHPVLKHLALKKAKR